VSTAVLDGNRLFVRDRAPVDAAQRDGGGYLNVLARAWSHGNRRSHVLSVSLAATLSRRPR
jgi:hypothetical protein